MLFSYPIATIKANIDNAFEENKIRLRELEGLELCSEQIPIFGEEVFKQNGVHGAPAKWQVKSHVNANCLSWSKRRGSDGRRQLRRMGLRAPLDK